MQFNFNCEQILGCDNNGYAFIEGTYQDAIKPGYLFYVHEIINSLGDLASKSRNLKTILTSAFKFFNSPHRMIIKAKENTVLGFIKVGVKKMMVKDQNNNFFESSPVTLFDFYVHETEQRKGHGKGLMDKILQFERLDASKIAYDMPNEKLINFVQKNYNLGNYVHQNSNFIVYPGFFENVGQLPKPIRNTQSGRSDGNNNNFSNIGKSLIYQNQPYQPSNQSSIPNNPINQQYSSQPSPNQIHNYNNPNPAHTPNSIIKANYINDSRKKMEMEGGLYQPNYILPHSTDKRDSSPLKGFHNRIFNTGSEASGSSEVFSSKRDFYDNINVNNFQNGEDIRYKYVQEKLGNTERNTEMCKERLRDLGRNINNSKLEFDDYYRRNEYSTIWDEKKSLAHSVDYSNELKNGNRHFITNKQFQKNLLPTTSQIYGLHHVLNK